MKVLIKKIFFVQVSILLLFSIRLNAQDFIVGEATKFSLGSAKLFLPLNWKNYGIHLESNGTIIFNGTNTQTLCNDSLENFYDIIVSNPSGIKLENSISIIHSLILSEGNVLTGNNLITLEPSSFLYGEQPGRFVIGNLKTSCVINNGQFSVFNSMGASLSAVDENLGDVTLTRISGAEVSLNNNSSISRRWIMTFQNSLTAERNLTLSWLPDEDNGKILTSMLAWKSTDDFTSLENTSQMGSIMDCSSRSITCKLDYIPALKPVSFTLTQSDEPIPVELSSFKVSIQGINILLEWRTVTEVNNYGFEIERYKIPNKNEMSENKNWQKIGFVAGAGSTTDDKGYSYLDKTALYGEFIYRLKQIDFDGSFKLSQEIKIRIGKKPTSFLINNFPNPFNPATTIRIEVPYLSRINLSIYNTTGEKVETLVDENMEEGIYHRVFDGRYLPSGVYIYILTSGNTVISSKMMLLK